MLECFIAEDSKIKDGVNIPTLVFKTLHDRYFKTHILIAIIIH